jgi:hypothetical protein
VSSLMGSSWPSSVTTTALRGSSRGAKRIRRGAEELLCIWAGSMSEVREEDGAAELENEVDDEEEPWSLLRTIMENGERDEQVNNGLGCLLSI